MKKEYQFFIGGVLTAIFLYFLYEYLEDRKINKASANNIFIPFMNEKKTCSCSSGKSSCGCGSHSKAMPAQDEYLNQEVQYDNGYYQPRMYDFNALINS